MKKNRNETEQREINNNNEKIAFLLNIEHTRVNNQIECMNWRRKKQKFVFSF